QHRRQCATVVGDALERGVVRHALALPDVVGDVGEVEVGGVVRPRRARDAVHGPRRAEVRLPTRLGEMSAVGVVGVVPVAGGNDRGVLTVVGGEVGADPAGDLGAAGDAEGTALDEVVLDVDDQQCATHVTHRAASRGRAAAAPGAS